MRVQAGAWIGLEAHPDTDECVRVEAGRGKAVFDSACQGRMYSEYELAARALPATSFGAARDTSAGAEVAPC